MPEVVAYHTVTMPQILIAGAPTGCWTNLGDEAILAGMAAGLRSAVPAAELAVVSSNPSGFLEGHGCAAVPYSDLDAVLDAVEAADLVVLGGGSIFFDYWGFDPSAVLTPRHQGLSLWAGLALAAAANDKPLMVYATGVGPLRSTGAGSTTRAIFELADAATLRDSASRAMLSDLGFTSDHVVVTADPAIGLELPSPPPVDLPRPWLGVSLRQWDLGVDQARWQREVGRAIERQLRVTGGGGVFVACHRGVSWPLTDDAAVADAVCSSRELSERVQLVGTEVGFSQRAALLASCDVVLAMRYHAALFALGHGVPAAGLSYDPKVAGLFADWSMRPLCVELGEVGHRQLARLLRRLGEREEVTAQIREQAVVHRLREKENAAIAAGLLTSGRSRSTGGDPARALLDLIPEAVEDRPGRAAELLRSMRGNLTDRRRTSPPAVSAKHPQRSADSDPTARRLRGGSVAILTNRLLDRETGEPCIGGVERYALELARLLTDLGLDPTFFQREGSGGSYFGFPVVGLPRGEPFSEFEDGVATEFFEQTHDFDHVLYLTLNYASGPMREDAVVVGHGVWWDHDLWGHLRFRTPEWYEHLEKVFTRPGRIISVDENLINVVRSLYPEAATRMTCLPNFVDIDRFHPPAERLWRDPAVLIPRRIDIIRGPRLVAPILERIPDACRVLWAGDGDEGLLAELRETASRDTRFAVRSASFDQMPELYRDADICLIPTIGSEGQSLACLEAMASGCAVVATRVGGLPEMIDDGVDGMLCDPTAEALSAAITRLIRDPALRQRLGSAARRSAARRSLGAWRARWASILADEGWIDRTTGAVPYDIVCFSVVNWEFRWQRPQQMMALWGRRGRRVFFLRTDAFLDPDRDGVATEPVAENVWEVRLPLPEGFDPCSGSHPDGFVAAGMASLQALRDQHDLERAVSVVELAGWTPLAAAAREKFGWPIVYDCMDDWSTFPGFADTPPFLAWEERLVEDADVLSVSSDTIARRWLERRPDLLIARNAADFGFFNQPDGDDPLSDLDGPVAGFFGAMTEWFDMELMEEVARSRPSVTFVLVGGVHRTSAEHLEDLPNVRFEGQQPYESMPLYLRRFDACMVPFRVSAVTDGMDVVKFYEYMSQGKPVVATPIREILVYRDLLYLADDPQEFATQLDRALVEDDPGMRARRIELARQSSWDERLDRIEERIMPHIEAGADLSRG